MEIIQLLNLAEKLLSERTYELLELRYSSATFGSGFIDYKIRSKYVRIVLDGKERAIEILISDSYTKYKADDWRSIYHGSVKNGKQNLPKILSSIYQPNIL